MWGAGRNVAGKGTHPEAITHHSTGLEGPHHDRRHNPLCTDAGTTYRWPAQAGHRSRAARGRHTHNRTGATPAATCDRTRPTARTTGGAAAGWQQSRLRRTTGPISHSRARHDTMCVGQNKGSGALAWRPALHSLPARLRVPYGRLNAAFEMIITLLTAILQVLKLTNTPAHGAHPATPTAGFVFPEHSRKL